jgi:hypothetical protein
VEKEVISGVGANSERTDLNLSSKLSQPKRDDIPSQFYGDTTQLNQMQAGADLQGKSYTVPKLTTPIPTPTGEPVVGLTTDTLRPDEPAEIGLPFGVGAGPEILLPQTSNRGTSLSNTFYDLAQADPNLQAVAEDLAAKGF